MPDAWDDSDDEWDVDSDDDEITTRLKNLNNGGSAQNTTEVEEEEDLTIIEKAEQEARSKEVAKTKGKALAAKKAALAAAKEEEEITRKAMEYESHREANMDPEERRLLDRKRAEESEQALADDLFGIGGGNVGFANNVSAGTGGVLILRDMKDHLKHAKAVGKCVKEHGKPHLALAMFREMLNECSSVLDDDSLNDLGKSLNVIRNTKIAEAKKLAQKKTAAQKPKKDKSAEAKAKKEKEDLFGDNDVYDEYDDYGAQYEDDFF